MKRLFSLTRALVARKRKIFALFFALAASIGMMNAKVTWNSSNISSDFDVHGTYASYSKEGVTLSANSDMNDAQWWNYGDESQSGISFNVHQTGGFTFSNSLGKNFTKIEMTLRGPGGWDMANLGSGWSFFWEPSEDNHATATWTGNASTVDLLKDASDLHGDYVKSIVFYFVGDSEEPDPTYTIALEDGTVNADKVTLSATSAVEGATITVTPDEEYEITAFSASYVVVEGSLGSIYEIDATLNPETGAYSFKMPAYDVTIEATIAAKPVPEGDIFAGFTATAGSGGFTNEGSANLVDNKFTSADWTKWCADNSYKSVPTGESGDACWWIDFEASAALNPTGYILTTGNDTGNEHGRNPKNWVLKAKLNAGDAWTTIATVTNDVTMKNKSFKDYKFFVDQSGSYKYFRFEVFANQGANVMQLCELRLIGTEAPGGGSAAELSALNLNVGDVIHLGDKLTLSSGTVEIGGGYQLFADGSPYTLARADIDASWNPIVSADGPYYVLLDNSGGQLLSRNYPVTANSDGIVITSVGSRPGIEKVYSIAVHEPNPSGTCGTDLTWELDLATGALTISGTGAMDNYSWDPNAAPWYVYKDAITSVSFPEGITTIGAYAFVNCDNAAFTTVTIPEGVTALGVNAFYNCDGIQEITIPSTVTTIEVGAIYDCKAVNSITSYIASPTSLHGFAIYGYKNTCTLYVPYASIDAYKAAECWKNIPNIAAIPGTLTPADVMALINAIGTVELTAECKAKIDAARAAFDALSDGDKALVTNSATLTQAETDYAALAAAAAAPVIAQIEALPTAVKLSTYFSTYDLMVAARAAYNALSAEAQAAVTNLSKLTNLEAAFAAIGGVNEKLSKPFSVGEGQVVYFSHGNLQATYNGTNWSWAFAAHQYEYIGDASGNIIINGNGTLSGAGTVDLFGWVANSSTVLTSGVAKYGVSNSENVGDYGLGKTETLKGDWGVAANDANIGGYNDWRILSKDEWVYLFKTRTDAASKYGYATVGGKIGVIIIPDAFTDPMKNKGDKAFIPQNVSKGYSTNVYTIGGDWEAMEAAGAVFMPAAGRRYGTTMTVNEGTGFYWSSTPMSYQASYFMGFMSSNVVPDNDRYRNHGLSVRLVSNNAPVASTPLDSARVVKDLIEAIPAEITLEDACVKAINDAREAYNKLGEAAKGLLEDATIAKLTTAEADLTALNQVEADKVVAKINEIPSPMTAADVKLSVYTKVQGARAAYDALTAEQQALVPTAELQKLTDAEAAFAAIGGGTKPVDIVWNKNTGIANVSPGSTSPAYEGMTVTTGSGSSFSQNSEGRMNFMFYSQNGGFTFANENGYNITKVVIESTTALTSTMTEVDRMGSGWAISNENKTATWTGDAATVKIWEGRTFTNYWYVDSIVFTVNGPASPLADAQAAKGLIDAIGEVSYPDSKEAIKAAREAVDALGANASLLDDADLQKLTDAETAYAGLLAQAVKAVKDQIDALPATPLTDATKKLSEYNKVTDAREAYNALSDEEKAAVTNYDKLEAAEAAFAAIGGGTGLNVSTEDIGKVLCADGSLYATKDEATAASKTPVAMIAYVEGSKGLAIALEDESDTKIWSTAITTAAAHTPAVTGGTWKLPSLLEWQQMFVGCGADLTPSETSGNVTDYLGLRDKLLAAGGNGFVEWSYWTTTEWADNPTEYAWDPYFSPDIVKWYKNKKDRDDFYIRAILAFNVVASSALADAQAALDKINAIPDSVIYTDACKETIDAARAAVDALGENASLIDDEDMAILTAAEARYEYLHNRPTPSFNPAPAAIENLKYTGTAQALITAGVATATTGDDVETCTVLYSLNNETYSENIPTGLAIGTYTVYYKVLESETHKAFGPATVNAQILKADAVYTAPAAYDTLVYNAATQTLITAGATEHGLIEYSPDGTNWSTELPTGLNAGTYTVYYRLTGDDFHSDVAATSVEVTIAKAALTATADSKTVTYGDAVPAYTVTYAGWVGGENETVLTGTLTLSCEYEPTSNAGEYAIIPSGVSADNYEITFVNGKLTVNKADAIFTAPKAVEELVYTSEKQTLVTAGECADGTFLYSLDNTNWVDTLPEVLNAATYTVYYKVQGDANHNDYIAAEPIAVSIAKAPLTITAENKEVVYGFAAPGFSVSYYGLKGSDLPADVLTGELAYACDYTAGSNVASYDITPSGQTSANYDITYVKGTLSVLKADPAFTDPVANTLTYNGGAQTLVAAGTTGHGTFEYTFTPNDEESWNTALPQAKDAGTYGVYYRVVGDHNHNDYESADAIVVTIAKAALTATADNKEVIYGDAVPAYTVTYAGWQGEENESVLTGSIAYACEYAQTSNVGDYTIVPSGVSNPNYAITFVNGKVTVSKAALTITADDKSVIYGDEAPAFTASYEGWKNEDNETVVSGLTLTSEYALTSNVGEYDIVPANATAQNYAISYTNGTLTVNKAALMITADDKSVIYGDEHPAFTASYEGWKNADNESVVSGLTLTSEYVLTSNVGEYDIVPANATAQNYAISYTNGTLTVNKAPLMITADDKSVIYGDEHPAFTASYEGWKNADNETVVNGLTLTSEYVLTSNVGEYDIVPANATAQNYAISYTNGTLTVNKAALMITADDKSVIYGDEHPAFTASYEGWKNADDESVVSGLTLTSEYVLTSNVGEYDIVPANATAQNYAISYTNGTLTVNKAPLMITADDKSVIYGDEHPAFTASYEGWKNADNESVVSGLTLTSEYVLTSNVGEYDIVPANAEAQNYAISYTNGTLTVNKAALMITADDKSVIYGDEHPAFTASYEGWKNADNESVVSGLTLTSEYVLTSNVGEYDIVPANAEAQNYAISYTNGTLTVNKAPLTITAEDKTMIYGDEAPEFTVTYAGWKNEDDEAVVSGLNYTCAYAPGSYIGTYVINPNSATAQNYAITFVDGTLTVNKATVYVSGADIQEAKFEDGNTTAVVLNAGVLNGIKLNDPIGHVTTASFSDATVGEGKTITMYYELTGNAALLANYNLDPTTEIFAKKGVIIENFVPAEEGETEKEDEEAQIEEGIEVYAYGYCDGSGYSLRYHLNSGNPDQYMIAFDDNRFEDVDWTNLDTPGKDGTIDIEIPVDLPTGDYTMTVTFRDHRFPWLPSNALDVTFHVNLPETYVTPLFDNTIALVDTCNCFTDIQWYHRADASEAWVAIPGATGHYYRPADGAKLTGEFFVKASMNGEPTYTCGQADMETLYGADSKQPKAIVKAFPNPVVSTTNVTIENSENWNHNLRIVNTVGIEMFRTTFEGNETVVSMDGFVQGNYMISVDGIVVKVMKK